MSKKNGGERFYRVRITFCRHCPTISTSAVNDSLNKNKLSQNLSHRTLGIFRMSILIIIILYKIEHLKTNYKV